MIWYQKRLYNETGKILILPRFDGQIIKTFAFKVPFYNSWSFLTKVYGGSPEDHNT